MKKFLFHILTFLTLLISIITLLILLSYSFCRYNYDFKILEDKNILIVGDSHPECALNDSILTNTVNLAQSGTAYFYSYLKVREFVNRNSHIDTVIISYSYDELSKDNLFSERRYILKMRNYFFLFNIDDYLVLLKSNPFDVLLTTPKTIAHNLKMSFRNQFEGLGRYLYLKRDKVKEAKKRLNNQRFVSDNLPQSNYQRKYLLKVYEFCQAKKIKLILLNTPIHPLMEEYQERLKNGYYDFAKENMPNAILINHSNFKMSENNYGDLNHLNFKGATQYSNFLKVNGFKQYSY